MKYLLFTVVFAMGVPLMAAAGAWSHRARGFLLAALVFSTVLGDFANINFMSLEAYRGPDRGFEVNLTDLITLSLVLSLLVTHAGRVQWLPYNTVPMAAFFALATVCTVMSSAPLLGSFTLFKLVRFYALYWCVVNCLRTGTNLEYIFTGFIGIALLLIAVVARQKYQLHIYRVHGTFDHSNTIPPYANQILPLLAVWSATARRATRTALAGIAVVGLLFAVMATFSRAGILLAGLGVFVSLALAAAGAPRGRVALLATLMVVASVAGSVKAWDTLIERFTKAPQSSLEARQEFNIAADMMAQRNPLGIGLNNFSHVLTNTPRYRRHITVMAGEEQSGVAHHIYRLTAAELGYSGLLLFLIVIARFTWVAAWRGMTLGGREGAVLRGILVAYLTLHASGFLEWTFRTTPVLYLFAILSGMVVALSRSAGHGRLPAGTCRPIGAAGLGRVYA